MFLGEKERKGEKTREKKRKYKLCQNIKGKWKIIKIAKNIIIR